jgi:hypothetical protein
MEGEMMSVAVRATGDAFESDTPVRLFRTDIQQAPGAQYDVTPDGQRFIVNVPRATGASETIGLVVNWQELMRRR